MELLGLHLTPVDFYQPIPDTRRLDPGMWGEKDAIGGIDVDTDTSLALFDALSAAYRAEWEEIARRRKHPAHPDAFTFENTMFGSVDAEMYYGLIRSKKPRTIIEIGGGHSTRLAAEAVRRNVADGGEPTDLIVCEPFPEPTLRAGFAGLSRLITSPVQDLPLSFFATLTEGDILFIDSSHVVKMGSDAQYEILEILPSLAPGVLVHIHDVFWPNEYPRTWVIGEHRFWNEQYVLQAFMSFNSDFEVVWAGQWISRKHGDRLAAGVPSFKHGSSNPSSLWIRRRLASEGGAQRTPLSETRSS